MHSFPVRRKRNMPEYDDYCLPCRRGVEHDQAEHDAAVANELSREHGEERKHLLLTGEMEDHG
jgi:hypothetical protein